MNVKGRTVMATACLVAAAVAAPYLPGWQADPAPTPITLVAASFSPSQAATTSAADTWSTGTMPQTGTWTDPATSAAARPPSTTPAAPSQPLPAPSDLSGGGAAAPVIPPRGAALAQQSTVPAVTPAGETVVMPGAQDDVADDIAIWRNPEHPEQSLIVGDNKADNGGVAVYRLDGSLAQYVPGGKIGNIDLRLAGVDDRAVVLVGANDRSNDTIRFWSLDPGSGALTSMEAGNLPTGAGNYGFCLGRDVSSAHTYAFVTARDSGRLEQYELWARDGRVDAVKVRSFDVGSISEACAVDDVTGALYVAQEAGGIWRYDVDPATGSQRTQVDRTGGGHLTPDVEGVSVVRGRDGRGYLLASSQGDSRFAVYDADGDHAFLGRFTVTGSGTVDGVSETDGMEATAGDFGPRFPHGLLVVHDAANERPGGGNEPASNLKLVPLDEVVSLAS